MPQPRLGGWGSVLTGILKNFDFFFELFYYIYIKNTFKKIKKNYFNTTTSLFSIPTKIEEGPKLTSIWSEEDTNMSPLFSLSSISIKTIFRMSILNLFSDKIVTFFYNISKIFFNTSLQDYFLIILLNI